MAGGFRRADSSEEGRGEEGEGREGGPRASSRVVRMGEDGRVVVVVVVGRSRRGRTDGMNGWSE